jgi:hypothetical protein
MREEYQPSHLASMGYSEEAKAVYEYDLEKGVDAVPTPPAP